MQHRTLWIPLSSAALIVAACVSRPATQTNTGSNRQNPDSNATNRRAATWLDSAGGVGIDSSGVPRMGRDRESTIALRARDVRSMSDPSIVAHVIKADSLAVAVSRVGALQAQDLLVRTFVERMIDEHGAHLRLSEDLAFHARAFGSSLASDTTGLSLATLIVNRLTREFPGDDHDRLLMSAQVVLHQQILHDLQLMQPRATAEVRRLVDQAIPIVKRNLADATFILETVTGNVNGR